ncbi:MAG: hypothetical protein WC356_04580 [Candidatus Micrarchaeia archaeon]
MDIERVLIEAEGKANTKELVSALCNTVWTWQGGDISNAMDGDEVDALVERFRISLNIMQGNV